jgi:hypothetical protein
VSRDFSLLALLTGVSLVWTPPARADRLDARLNSEMPKLVKFIKDNGYKNVAVLRFRVQRGTGKSSFSVGPINGSMAERIENLLLVNSSTERGPLFGITHDAGHAAQQSHVAAWTTSETERRKLFDVNYPLAWGNDRVKVDAFITGKIVNVGDRRKTTVTLEAFSRTNLTLTKVAEFTLDTDQSLIRDLGYNFALSRGEQQTVQNAPPERKLQVLDDLTFTQVGQSEKRPSPSSTEKPGRVGPTDVGGIKVEMILDGNPVAIDELSAGEARYQVACPNKGQKVVFVLTNSGAEKRGVVLKVAGYNTIDQQTDDSARCRKWILKPGARYQIKGYYFGEKADKLTSFDVLDGEAAKKVVDQNGEWASFIQLDVFREDPGFVADEFKQISARAMKREVAKAARTTHQTLKTQLLKSLGLSVKDRGSDGAPILGPTEAPRTDTTASKVEEFNNFQNIASLSIRVVPGGATTSTPQPEPQLDDK